VTPIPLEGTLVGVGVHPVDTVHGAFRGHVFHNLATGRPALALAHGDVQGAAPLLARVHSSCITGEVYAGCDCDCAEQLDGALRRIAAAGRGVLFYLVQEGRGAGFAAKARDRMLVQASGNRLTTFDAYAQMGLPADSRRYDEVAAMGRALGVAAPLVLLTNNPDKVTSLTGLGVAIDGTAPLPPGVSSFNRHYLAAKRRSGHTIAAGDGSLARPPAPVELVAAARLAGAPHLLHVASYFLPVRLVPPAWFRVHVYLDTAAGLERVVLAHGTADRAPLLRVERDVLRERLPLRVPAVARRWRAAAERIVAHGAGAVVFDNARGWDDAVPADPDAAAALLAAHAPGSGARFLVDGADRADATPAALERRGLSLGPPLPLAS
jgi:3,4-dihydroxy 2-butanone 4-phosphate synthase / GTP cyclohydrolase II